METLFILVLLFAAVAGVVFLMTWLAVKPTIETLYHQAMSLAGQGEYEMAMLRLEQADHLLEMAADGDELGEFHQALFGSVLNGKAYCEASLGNLGVALAHYEALLAMVGLYSPMEWWTRSAEECRSTMPAPLWLPEDFALQWQLSCLTQVAVIRRQLGRGDVRTPLAEIRRIADACHSDHAGTLLLGIYEGILVWAESQEWFDWLKEFVDVVLEVGPRSKEWNDGELVGIQMSLVAWLMSLWEFGEASKLLKEMRQFAAPDHIMLEVAPMEVTLHIVGGAFS